jgi:hypothetical protein
LQITRNGITIINNTSGHRKVEPELLKMQNTIRKYIKISYLVMIVWAVVCLESVAISVLIELNASIGIIIPVSLGSLIGLIYLGYIGFKASMEYYDDYQKQEIEFNKKFPRIELSRKEAYPMTDTEKTVSMVSHLGIWVVYIILAALGMVAIWAITRAFGVPIWAFCIILTVFFVIPFVAFCIFAYRAWKKRKTKDDNQNQKEN